MFKRFLKTALISILLAGQCFAATLQFVGTIDFTDADSGYVKRAGATYSIGTGWGNCNIALIPLTQVNQRAVFRFPTAGTIPSNATVTVVEFFNVFAVLQPSPPTTASASLLGAWCGTALSADSTDWTASGATDLSLQPHLFGADTWVDLSSGGADPTPLINLDPATNSGITDLMFKDTTVSIQASGCNWNTSKGKCKLRVTYTVPIHALPSVGVGAFRYIRGVDLKKGVVIFRQTFNPIGA